MKTTILKSVAILLLSVFTLACTKTEKGPKGDTGSAGQNGTNGTNGVANITTITLTVNSWAWDNSYKWSGAVISNITQLTQNNVDKAMIMIYEDFGNSTYLALPSVFIVAPDLSYHTICVYQPNSIQIYKFLSDESDPSPSAPTKFKLVIIPPSMVKPNINHHNYRDVMIAYNL